MLFTCTIPFAGNPSWDNRSANLERIRGLFLEAGDSADVVYKDGVYGVRIEVLGRPSRLDEILAAMRDDGFSIDNGPQGWIGEL